MNGHVCSWYCQGEVHCTKILTRPGVALEATIAFHQALYGAQFVAVRPAPEADLQQWMDEETWLLPVEGFTVPLLLFIRPPFLTREDMARRYGALGYPVPETLRPAVQATAGAPSPRRSLLARLRRLVPFG